MNFTDIQRSICTFYIALVVCSCGSAFAGPDLPDSPQAKRYTDPKGFFNIVPPVGWEVQTYGDDVRGKVAFLGPEPKVDLRVLVDAVSFSSASELVDFCRSVEDKYGFSTNIRKAEFDGRPGVTRNFVVAGLKVLAYDFLIGNVKHNIQYTAPERLYDKYYEIVAASIETYEYETREAGSEQVVQHRIAKKLRLAQLMRDSEQYALALQYIDEGLELSPQEQAFIDLRTEVEQLRQRTSTNGARTAFEVGHQSIGDSESGSMTGDAKDEAQADPWSDLPRILSSENSSALQLLLAFLLPWALLLGAVLTVVFYKYYNRHDHDIWLFKLSGLLFVISIPVLFGLYHPSRLIYQSMSDWTETGNYLSLSVLGASLVLMLVVVALLVRAYMVRRKRAEVASR